MTAFFCCLLLRAENPTPIDPEPKLAVERLAPAILKEQHARELHGFIMDATEERPASFLPARAKFMVFRRGPLPEWDATPAEKPVVEYVTMIIEDRVAEPTGIAESAAVYWYRPNPESGKYGVTVRRVFEFAKGGRPGGLVGVEYWFHYPTRLSPEEANYARDKSTESREALAFMSRFTDDPEFDFDNFDFEKQKRFEQRVEIDPFIAGRNVKGRSPGDRVAIISYRDTFTKNEIKVSVNVTQQQLISPEDLKR